MKGRRKLRPRPLAFISHWLNHFSLFSNRKSAPINALNMRSTRSIFFQSQDENENSILPRSRKMYWIQFYNVNPQNFKPVVELCIEKLSVPRCVFEIVYSPKSYFYRSWSRFSESFVSSFHAIFPRRLDLSESPQCLSRVFPCLPGRMKNIQNYWNALSDLIITCR